MCMDEEEMRLVIAERKELSRLREILRARMDTIEARIKDCDLSLAGFRPKIAAQFPRQKL